MSGKWRDSKARLLGLDNETIGQPRFIFRKNSSRDEFILSTLVGQANELDQAALGESPDSPRSPMFEAIRIRVGGGLSDAHDHNWLGSDQLVDEFNAGCILGQNAVGPLGELASSQGIAPCFGRASLFHRLGLQPLEFGIPLFVQRCRVLAVGLGECPQERMDRLKGPALDQRRDRFVVTFRDHFNQSTISARYDEVRVATINVFENGQGQIVISFIEIIVGVFVHHGPELLDDLLITASTIVVNVQNIPIGFREILLADQLVGFL